MLEVDHSHATLQPNATANDPIILDPKRKASSMKETSDRFIETHWQQIGLANRTYILVDRQTGVNYLLAGFVASTGVNCTGMTVLLDADGKPVITPVEERD